MLQLQLLLQIQLLQLLHGLLLRAAIQKPSRWRVTLITVTCACAESTAHSAQVLYTVDCCHLLTNVWGTSGSHHVCLLSSLQPSGTTAEPAFPPSSHTAGDTPEEINATCKTCTPPPFQGLTYRPTHTYMRSICTTSRFPLVFEYMALLTLFPRINNHGIFKPLHAPSNRSVC